jgi:type IV pilus assembly protein PilY1
MMQISRARRALAAMTAAIFLLGSGASALATTTDLADAPLFSTVSVPGNLMLALSVEFPTASTAAYANTTAYATATEFVGYFDPNKCYTYSYNSTTPALSYFVPTGSASTHACSSSWSGNYLNWASMQSLDEFRWVLTGGNRIVDTATQTILQKTYHSGQATSSNTAQNKAISGSTLIAGATPLPTSWGTLTTRTAGTGIMMFITGNSSATGMSLTTATSPATTPATYVPAASTYSVYTGSSYSTLSSTTVYAFYMNVQVCASATLKETNCVLYGSSTYKPEGLMQTYSSKLRYASMGYLSDPGSDSTNLQRNGGVLRAAMAFVGPTVPQPGSAAIANTAPEWSSSTGIMAANPDASDATATTSWSGVTISQSGVLNYLNKFGYTGGKYKYYDPVGELYYTAIRYFKNLSTVPSYYALTLSSSSTSTKSTLLDGFPVITTQTDPIIYSCQKNFILGLGDTNTNYDAGLPGNASNAAGLSTYNEPAMASEVQADNSMSVITATNMIGKLEAGSTNLASTNVSNGTYYMGGLAYDAHVNGVRSYTDSAGNVTKSTVNTYWLDVLEGQTYKATNQYYYATKYGGFTLPKGVLPYGTTSATGTVVTIQPYSGSNAINKLMLSDGTSIALGVTNGTNALWHTNSDLCLTTSFCASTVTSGNYRPDNYFTANNADNMKTSLTAAFEKIIGDNDPANTTTLATPSVNTVNSGSVTYGATYDPSTWTGEVTASTISFASDGTPTTSQQWDARALLSASTVTATTRKIITCCTSSATVPGLAFSASGLQGGSLISRTASAYATYFAQVPGVSASYQSSANFLAYLRGDTSQELANSGHYRTRSYRLGDIVNSKPTAVGAPNQVYYDATNPGYSSFKATYASRPTMVYVGANDGMMHAFIGSTGATNSGKEAFAYVPSFVYGDSSTFATSGIATLGNPTFSHHYFVDSTPGQFDVDLINTYASSSQKASSATRSMCNSSQSGSATNWCTLLIGGLGKGGKGYYALDVTDSTTLISASESALAAKVMWEFTDTHMGYSYGMPSVVKTKKWGWVVVLTSGYNNDDGIGYFYFVSPSTGALLERVATPEGSTTSPIDMGQHTAYQPDYTDGTADAIYGADLQGNIWRLDVTASAGSYPSPTKIALLQDASGNGQPVTTRPLVEPDTASTARYVLVGTGRLLGDSDIASARVQSFYAIIDGTASSGGFYTASGLPSGVNFPIQRNELNRNTDLTAGITAASGTVGWYFDLPVTSSIAERVNIDPTVTSGVVAWAGNLPNGSACSPSGTGETYATAFSTGKSVLWDSSTNSVVSSFANTTGVITDVSFINVNGTTYLYSGDSTGAITKDTTKISTTGGVKQLNWRDVPLAN